VCLLPVYTYTDIPSLILLAQSYFYSSHIPTRIMFSLYGLLPYTIILSNISRVLLFPQFYSTSIPVHDYMSMSSQYYANITQPLVPTHCSHIPAKIKEHNVTKIWPYSYLFTCVIHYFISGLQHSYQFLPSIRSILLTHTLYLYLHSHVGIFLEM